MSRKKLKKFAAFETFANTFSFPDTVKGQWQGIFGNANPVTVELACGHGVFLVEMAQRHPKRNFIGIDIKSARLWAGAKRALVEGLDNVRFVRAQIEDLEKYFASSGVPTKNEHQAPPLPLTKGEAGRGSSPEIAELWITFPDPFPKKRQTKKRLTSPRFLEMYEKSLRPDGLLHLKTDDRNLFEYSLQSVEDRGPWRLETLIDNVHADAVAAKTLDLDIISRYEELHLRNGKRIFYARWRRQASHTAPAATAP